MTFFHFHLFSIRCLTRKQARAVETALGSTEPASGAVASKHSDNKYNKFLSNIHWRTLSFFYSPNLQNKESRQGRPVGGRPSQRFRDVLKKHCKYRKKLPCRRGVMLFLLKNVTITTVTTATVTITTVTILVFEFCHNLFF